MNSRTQFSLPVIKLGYNPPGNFNKIIIDRAKKVLLIKNYNDQLLHSIPFPSKKTGFFSSEYFKIDDAKIFPDNEHFAFWGEFETTAMGQYRIFWGKISNPADIHQFIVEIPQAGRIEAANLHFSQSLNKLVRVFQFLREDNLSGIMLLEKNKEPIQICYPTKINDSFLAEDGHTLILDSWNHIKVAYDLLTRECKLISQFSGTIIAKIPHSDIYITLAGCSDRVLPYNMDQLTYRNIFTGEIYGYHDLLPGLDLRNHDYRLTNQFFSYRTWKKVPEFILTEKGLEIDDKSIFHFHPCFGFDSSEDEENWEKNHPNRMPKKIPLEQKYITIEHPYCVQALSKEESELFLKSRNDPDSVLPKDLWNIVAGYVGGP